jgi:leucyl aminopeptidase (aminopeptidase T)
MAKEKKVDVLLEQAATVAVRDVLGVKKGERVSIITNPVPDVDAISRALFRQVESAGGEPLLIIQPVKGQLDFADEAVISALKSKPEVVLSISHEKLGKDREALANPIRVKKRGKRSYRKYHHAFEYLLNEKRSRSFWSPSVTLDMFIRTVPIDYDILQERAAKLGYALSRAEEVHISAPGGTDLTVGLRGRKARKDDGNFKRPGSGGNLPCGEVFISPELGTSSGVLAFDGSISSDKGVIMIERPIRCQVENGLVKKVSGGIEARKLRSTLDRSEAKAKEMAAEGKLPPRQGDVFAMNTRNLGELGIGLNPAARIVGNMLEDEKAFKTCHLALGANYDDDAPALTHLDGLVKEPTVTIRYPSGRARIILQDGELV